MGLPNANQSRKWHVTSVPETGSTNADLLQQGFDGAADRTVLRADFQSSGGGAGGGSGQVSVPMQGTIVKVLVEVGQAVEAGQSVVVLEAMKMENQIEADKTGTVKAVNVKPGDTVGAGDVVVVIE